MAAATDNSTKELWKMVKENQEGLATLSKGVTQLIDQFKRTPQNGSPNRSDVFGVPNIRYGEDPMSSRGFSFMKMLGLITQAVNGNEAKVERDFSDRLVKCYQDQSYTWGGAGIPNMTKFLAPLSTKFLASDVVPGEFRREMRQSVAYGVEGADWDEMKWIRRKQLTNAGYNAKALSWLNELSGGALVAPPEMGELIELLRNKEACVNAGARVVPLPPQGRMKFPRQTGASLTYWVGENAPINDSNIATGEVTLQAKKLAVMIKAPNELIRFASPAAEALMRDDMTKSLALGLDLACLEGSGTDQRPRGVINHQNIIRLNSSVQTADGDKLVGQDVYRMIAAIEELNAEMEGWIMRPKTLYKYYQLRADAAAQGDQAGMFLFGLLRDFGDGAEGTQLGGYPVTKSTQVSQVRSKGASSNLTYITWGMWSDMLIGMFGAIEFAASTMGDTMFTNDQTWVRGILSADVALRHEVSFGIMDNLNLAL